MKRVLSILLVLVVISVSGWYVFSRNNTVNNSDLPQPGPNSNKETPSEGIEPEKPTSSFDKSRYSLSAPESIWVVVNKLRPLEPKTYQPADLTTPNVPLRVPGNESMRLRKVPAEALETMFAAAKGEDINLMLSSGHRSYSYQTTLYSSYVNKYGQAEADKESARPGHSEHQTGLAVDVCNADKPCDLEESFGSSRAGKWVAANAHKYGFIIRYPQGKSDVTGYVYEPWHLRYVGEELATEINRLNSTMEEFFGLKPAPDYAG